MSGDLKSIVVKAPGGLHARVSISAIVPNERERVLITLVKVAPTRRGFPTGRNVDVTCAVGDVNERPAVRRDRTAEGGFVLQLGPTFFYLPETSAKKVAAFLDLPFPIDDTSWRSMS